LFNITNYIVHGLNSLSLFNACLLFSTLPCIQPCCSNKDKAYKYAAAADPAWPWQIASAGKVNWKKQKKYTGRTWKHG